MTDALRYIQAEIKLYAGRPGAWLSVCLFFVIAGVSFPFTLTTAPSPDVWHGLLWLLFLIGPALSATGIFSEDVSSGRLERAVPLHGAAAIFIAKWAVCFILYALPSGLLAPFVAHMAGAPFADPMQAALLFIVAGALSALLCTFCGALGAGSARQDAAGTVLLMPLYVPILIFGAAGTADPAHAGDAFTLFSACLLLFAPLCGALGAYILREAVA